MEASRNGLERILTGVERLNDLLSSASEKELSGEEKKNLETKAELVKKFEAAMDDDFNTADAISAVFELVKLSNSTISEESAKAYLSELKKEIETLCGVLGIITEKKKEALDSEIEAMIEARQQARSLRISRWQTRSAESFSIWESSWRTPERALNGREFRLF